MRGKLPMSKQWRLPAGTRSGRRARKKHQQHPSPRCRQENSPRPFQRKKKSGTSSSLWVGSGEELLAQGPAAPVAGPRRSRPTRGSRPGPAKRGNLRAFRPPGSAVAAASPPARLWPASAQTDAAGLQFSGDHGPSSLFQLGGQRRPLPFPGGDAGRRRSANVSRFSGLGWNPGWQDNQQV